MADVLVEASLQPLAESDGWGFYLPRVQGCAQELCVNVATALRDWLGRIAVMVAGIVLGLLAVEVAPQPAASP